ncbi:hypothetical protein D3C72_1468990 [compost metagenome]
MAAMASPPTAEACASAANCRLARSVARLTEALCTPGTAWRARSTRPTQDAQVIPSMGSSSVAGFFRIAWVMAFSSLLDHVVRHSKDCHGVKVKRRVGRLTTTAILAANAYAAYAMHSFFIAGVAKRRAAWPGWRASASMQPFFPCGTQRPPCSPRILHPDCAIGCLACCS